MIPRYSRRLWPGSGRTRASWSAGSRSSSLRSTAWAEVGGFPKRPPRRSAPCAVPPTPERVAEIEARHPARHGRVRRRRRGGLGEEGRWFHYGLTSSDVVDTALALQIREAGALIARRPRPRVRCGRRARRGAPRHVCDRAYARRPRRADDVRLKLAGWAFELDRDRARVARALEGLRVGKLSGRRRHVLATDPEVERLACERLGLEPAPVSTQILQRDRHAELLAALAVLPPRSTRFALEVRHLARTEVREVEEPFARARRARRRCRTSGTRSSPSGSAGSRASSAAPRSSGSRTSRSGTSATSPTRRPSASSSRTRSSRSTTCSTASRGSRKGSSSSPSGCGGTSTRATACSSASAPLLALVEAGLARDEAYRLVQRTSMRAWEEEHDFRELVRADAEIAGRESTSTSVLDSSRTPVTSTPSSSASTRSPRREEPVHA